MTAFRRVRAVQPMARALLAADPPRSASQTFSSLPVAGSRGGRRGFSARPTGGPSRWVGRGGCWSTRGAPPLQRAGVGRRAYPSRSADGFNPASCLEIGREIRSPMALNWQPSGERSASSTGRWRGGFQPPRKPAGNLTFPSAKNRSPKTRVLRGSGSQTLGGNRPNLEGE